MSVTELVAQVLELKGRVKELEARILLPCPGHDPSSCQSPMGPLDAQAINWRAVAVDIFNSLLRLKEVLDDSAGELNASNPRGEELTDRDRQVLELQIDAFEKACTYARPRGHIPAPWMMHPWVSAPEEPGVK